MKRFILTGTPGSGKTVILRRLERDGFGVVQEAATDIIAMEQAQGCAEPWRDSSFIDKIVDLQKLRQVRASHLPDNVQFHDRSVVCSAALARYLGYSLSAKVQDELARIRHEQVFQSRVFFVQNLGFLTPSEARRISFEDALRFEQVHEATYREFGFEIALIGPGSVRERVAAIKALL